MIAERHWERWIGSLPHQPWWVRWGVIPTIGPAVIFLYFACMWPRTTVACGMVLAIVYGALLKFGIVGAEIFVRGARGVAITYLGMVAMVYAESSLTALKDFAIARIRQHYGEEDQA